MVRGRQLLLAVLQQRLQAPNALVPRNQLPLRNRDLLLQTAVLLDQLPLHDGQLLEVALQESHFLLLGAVVGGAQDVVVLLASLVEGDFELDDLGRRCE